MPAGNFIYDLAKAHFAISGPTRFWDGSPTPGGLGEYRLLLVCGGGVANGLDDAAANDVDFLGSASSSLWDGATSSLKWMFNGAGYNGVLGEPLPGLTVVVDEAADSAKLSFTSFILGSVGAGGPPDAFGSHATITDLVVIWTRNAGAGSTPSMKASMMIARFDVSAAPITPNGANLFIACPADGLIKVT